jgi:Flp pilus assembly pilin Flp
MTVQNRRAQEVRIDLVEYGLMAGVIAMAAGAIMPELVAQASHMASNVSHYFLFAASIGSGS